MRGRSISANAHPQRRLDQHNVQQQFKGVGDTCFVQWTELPPGDGDLFDLSVSWGREVVTLLPASLLRKLRLE